MFNPWSALEVRSNILCFGHAQMAVQTSLISKKTPCPHFHENYKSEPTVLKSTITKSYHNSPHIVMGYTFDFCEILKNQEMISVNFNTKFEI